MSVGSVSSSALDPGDELAGGCPHDDRRRDAERQRLLQRFGRRRDWEDRKVDVRIHEAREERAPLTRDFLGPGRYGHLGIADGGDSALADDDRLSLDDTFAIEHPYIANDVGVPGLRRQQRDRRNEQKDGERARSHHGCYTARTISEIAAERRSQLAASLATAFRPARVSE